MRQYRIITPTSSITNFTPKLTTDNKKDKVSTSANSNADTVKRKTNVVSANHSPTIRKMIKMRSRTTNNSVSPEEAAVVVKNYILPLFRMEKETKHIKRRTEAFSLKGKTDFKEVGMLSDFRLVEDLHNQVESLKKQQEIKENEFKKAVQDREVYESDYKTLNERCIDSETNIACLNFFNTQVLKKQHQEQFSSFMIREQCNKFRVLYESELENTQRLSKVIEEEKAKNDKVKNVAVKLEYVNSLLVMENDLLGEKLKGVILSLEHITGSSSCAFKIQEEFHIVSQMLKILASESLNELHLSQNIKDEKDELEILVKELSDITLGIQDRKDKYIKLLRDKNVRNDSELKQAVMARDKFKSDFEELNKKFLDLQEEHSKLRLKLNKIKKSFSDDLFYEKYCKNCQKPYKEATNFNWSCKRHASPFADDVYWCCGLHDRNSQGCITSKHISSELEVPEKEADTISLVFCSVSFI